MLTSRASRDCLTKGCTDIVSTPNHDLIIHESGILRVKLSPFTVTGFASQHSLRKVLLQSYRYAIRNDES